MDRARRMALDALTPREREVLVVMATGEGNRALARRLGIAERTVKAHLTSITRKLGLGSRIEAVILAREYMDDAPPQARPRPADGVNGVTSLA